MSKTITVARTHSKTPMYPFVELVLGLALVAFPASITAQGTKPAPLALTSNASGQAEVHRIKAFEGLNAPVLVELPMAKEARAGTLLGGKGNGDERPDYQVRVPYRLAMGETEVTFTQWQQCVEEAGCNNYMPPDNGWGKDKHPVINVSFIDLQSYLAWANKKANLSDSSPYRLRIPTEAEWEYAARAGSDEQYSLRPNNSDYINEDDANYDNKFGKTESVMSYPPNGFGLYEMHGNVAEWVQDCYDTNAYGKRKSTPWDARNTSQGSEDNDNGCERVVRGGSWSDSYSFLRSGYRFVKKPQFRANTIGWRLARTLP